MIVKTLAALVLIASPVVASGASRDVPQRGEIPAPVVPVYDKLRDLHLTTQLIAQSKPEITIIAPAPYAAEGLAIQEAVHRITGVAVPLADDHSPEAAVPLRGNLILLGNRSTNAAIGALYDRAYTFLDLKYPGPEGFVVRSLHSPFGDGRNVLFAGGSDLEGVKAATGALIEMLAAAGGKPGDLSVGYLCKIQLGKGYVLPAEGWKAEIWEACRKDGSKGYFGWNSITKQMALYYMTGQERYLTEFLRLAFPDAAAIKEIEQHDGELIEIKNDPLAGPNQYGSYMMIVLWDLIEESPSLTDAQRLQITNAFARQLAHRVSEYASVYRKVKPEANLGDLHHDWAAFSMYALARYFDKYYPSPLWRHCLEAADRHFSAGKGLSWMSGNDDHLFWYPTYYDPLLDYLILTGNRDPEVLANLRTMMETQQIISTGVRDDPGLYTSSLSMLNKAAYVLNDGRWLYFRERNGVNTDVFRLGMSFWPGPDLKPAPPVDLVGKWTMQWMPQEMWSARQSGLPLEQSFRWCSYRSELGPGGDYVQLTGYNAAGRNPYHTFDILNLRLNGATLLRGYGNQVLVSADGMVEPIVAMDAALLYRGVVGQVAAAVGDVPRTAYADWRRSLAVRLGQYALIADELTFRADSDNILAETSWETPKAAWDPEFKFLKIPSGIADPATYELHPSDPLEVNVGAITTMRWRGSAEKGQRRVFFHLLGRNASGRAGALADLRLADNATALALPEPAVAAVGRFEGLDGDLALLSEKTLCGHALRAAGLDQPLLAADAPVEADWEFDTGNLTVVNSQPVTIKLALLSPELTLNGRPVTGKASNGLYAFEVAAGRQEITGAKPSAAVAANLAASLPALLLQARQARAHELEQMAAQARKPLSAPALSPVLKASLGGAPVQSIVVPSSQGDLLCAAAGKTVFLLGPDGVEVRKLTVAGDVRVLRWWAEPKLLLVGCADEQVLAFDEQGQKKWAFTSVMDRAVYEDGKQWWFKSAYPGVFGLFSGEFDGGKSRAFVGSACTLEILDETGALVKRLPVYWGPGRQFLLVNAADGSKNLLVGRWDNDWVVMDVIGSRAMAQVARGYDGVPPGCTVVGGWKAMNRYDNYLVDLYGDGKREVVSAINGLWNRITIYTEAGEPLYNAQFGPGKKEPRGNLRMMDVGDLDGHGKLDIVVGLSSGLVDVLDGQARKVWSKLLSSPPTVVKVVPQTGSAWICVGCEDGTVLALDAHGKILEQGSVPGRAADVQVLNTAQGPIAIVTTNTGEATGFRLR